MRLSLPRRAREQAPDAVRPRWSGLFRLVLLVLLAAWIVRALIVAPFSIPSGSMLPTLLVGDYVAAVKWPYGYSRHSFPWEFPPIEDRLLPRLPERGDVVVFRAPGTDADFVKRVIGLPGDRVELRRGRVVLNGRVLPRRPAGTADIKVSANSPCRAIAGGAAKLTDSGRSCTYPTFRESLPGGASYRIIEQVESGPADDFRPAVVPAGHLFLLGDNRDDSLDSRFSPAQGGIGFVRAKNLVGRAELLVWSTDGSADYWKPWTWFSALRARRLGQSVTERE